MKQIERYRNGNVIKFNFDNGLTVRAQFGDGGMVYASTERKGKADGYPQPFGADAFADYLIEVSTKGIGL